MSKNLSVARLQVAAILIGALQFLLVGFAPAQTNIHEFDIVNQTAAEPRGIAYGPDGTYWFTEESSGKLGHIDPRVTSNYISEIFITNKAWCHPFGITAGTDGGMWFTETGNSIVGRLDPTKTNYVEYTLPFTFSQANRTNAQPTSIITGPGSNIWFVEYALNRIASITPTSPILTNANGTIHLNSETQVRTNSMITGLTTGPDGNLWFCENNWGIIGRITPDGTSTNQLTEFTNQISSNAQPMSITAGPDGAMWFTEFNSNRIGRITLDGSTVMEFDIPNPNGIHLRPYGICAGQDGRLWFALFNGSAVGSITTNGVITLFPTPTPGSNPSFIATGNPALNTNNNDTNIWFSEDYGYGFASQKIARLLVGEALNLSAPTSASYTSGTTVSGLQATYQNANGTNLVVVYWGDGQSNYLRMTNTAPYASTNLNAAFGISNTVPIDTNAFATGGGAGTFVINLAHKYATSFSNYTITLAVTDSSGAMAVAKIALPPPFFNGQIRIDTQVDFLQFQQGTNLVDFGYYSLTYFPWVYHYDMGWEYFYPANDGQNGAYLYDLKSGHFFYTTPALFPYLYDFTLNTWLYYFFDTTTTDRYTSNPRQFYDFGTGQVITE